MFMTSYLCNKSARGPNISENDIKSMMIILVQKMKIENFDPVVGFSTAHMLFLCL